MEHKIKIGKDFLPEHTFDCGQCFRWNKEADGSFTGIAFSRAVNIGCDGEWALIKGAEEQDLKLWSDYLDAERDYGAIKEKVSVNDVMKEASRFGYGIRILRQEFFESLMSFIISQRSSIPKIKGCIEKICKAYGEEIYLGDKVYYSFPTAERLKDVKESDFEKFGVGYRAKYLQKAVHGILDGTINEEEIKSQPTNLARESLKKIYGVGDKVADCILLFGMARFDSFPVDVWISRAMAEYFDGKDGYELFGENSGFAQQYLFYWKRSIG